MVVVFWIMSLYVLDAYQFEFDGSLQECKRIAKNRESKISGIKAGCYEIHTYPFYIVIK